MIRYGIIGTGRMGNNHASCIQKIDNATVTALYDIKPEAAQAASQKYGAAICNSPEELAQRPDVDAVIITSPTYIHKEGVLAAMKAHKAIFCEKALCRHPADADELLKLGEAYDNVFTVGFVRRHMPKSILVKKLLADNAIGKLRYCNVDLPLGCYKRMPGDWFADFDLCGGVIIDMLAHHIDLANWFLGAPKRVYADSLLMSKDQPLPSDYVASVVTYENDVICNMMCSWARFGRTTELMEIFGDQGALVLDSSQDVTYYTKDGEKKVLNAEEEVKKNDLDPALNQVSFGNGFMQELGNLTNYLDGNKDIKLPTIRDAWNSLHVSFGMIASTKTRQVIEL